MIRVDELYWAHRGKLYCHMTADTLPELHAFAEKIGLKRCWFHRSHIEDHYDLNKAYRDKALANGAVFVGAIAQARVRMAKRKEKV